MKKNIFCCVVLLTISTGSAMALPGVSSVSKVATAVIDAVAKGGADLSESVGCGLLGGIKSESLDVLQKVKAGKLTVDDNSKLEMAIASGLCIKGRAKVIQDIDVKDVSVTKDSCASIAAVGSNAGCSN